MTATARTHTPTSSAGVVYRPTGVSNQELAVRPAQRVAVRVECGWAAQAAAHAIRRVGADPVFAMDAAAAPPRSGGGPPLVYDLSPWDSSALAFLRQRSAALATAPILLYLPPTGAAFAALAHVPKSEYTGLQVQARDGNSLRHLHDATNTLVNGLPRVHIMRQLTEAIPDLSGVARLFAHRALRILGSGQRPTVAAIARGLGLSPRTLQRRFAADGLPPPKALLDGLTLAHVDAVARMQNLSVARAAARAGLTSNDLYRLRKRGAHTNVLPSEVLVRRIRGN